MSPLAELRDWLSGRGLEVVLIILGSILLARFVAWVGGRITDRIDSRSTGGDVLVRSEAAKHRHSLTQVLTWAAIVLIYSIAVFFVLDRLGVPVTGLVAPATVLGVGLGFGAQRIVGDVLAGFFIITERQYGFGDVVSISVTGAGEPATGTVEDVTLRVTRMRSPNGEVVTVPNGAIAKVVNLSRDWARAVVDVPIPTTRGRQPGERDPARGGPRGLPRPGPAPAAARPAQRHGRGEPGPRAGQRPDGRPHAARQAVRGGPRPARPRRPRLPRPGAERAAAAPGPTTQPTADDLAREGER